MRRWPDRARRSRRSRARRNRPAASPAARRRQPTRRRPRRAQALSFLAELLFRRANLPVDGAAIDGVAVAVEGAGPRGDRLVVARALEQQVAVVILDDRIGRELIRRALQVLLGEIQLVRL